MMIKSSKFSIDNRCISPNHRPYCIAEVGINHNGSEETACKLIDVAKNCGADAVKFQTFKAKEFCGDSSQLFTYKSQGVSVTEPMLTMFERYEFTEEVWTRLKAYADKRGITFLSTPQNESDMYILERLGVPAIKVGSDDLTNTELIRSYATRNLPLILSCGMSDVAEIHNALMAAGWFEGNMVALLLCTSEYPTPPEHANVSKLRTIQGAFPGLLVGFSDHTQDSVAATVAVGLGARIFEKHFTLSHDLPGPDHWFSETPITLTSWISSIHSAFETLGSDLLLPTTEEATMRLIARRSIVAVDVVNPGDVLTPSNIGLRRPGTGLPPSMLQYVMGLRSTRRMVPGDLVTIGDLAR